MDTIIAELYARDRELILKKFKQLEGMSQNTSKSIQRALKNCSSWPAQ
jgi:hypothetical protein